MGEPGKSLAMRIEGVDGRESAVADALRPRDPDVAVTLDPATAITHLTSVLEAVEIEDLLTKAGFVVSAPTG